MPVNWRRDPFTGEDLSVQRTDRYTVPSNNPYHVKLLEVPRQDSPSSLLVAGASVQTNRACLEDAWVYEGNPDTNTGSSPILVFGRDGSGGFYKYRSLLKIDLTGYSGPLLKAVLRIYNQGGGAGASQSVGVHRITASWSATTVTWNNQPAHNAVAEGTVTIYGAGWYEVDVTDLVNAWLAATLPNYGVLLKHTNEISATDTTRNLSSLEAPDGNDPQFRFTESGDTFTEVATSQAPGAGEFACNYEQAWLNFPASAAGQSVDVTMMATGSPIDEADAGGVQSILTEGGPGGALNVLTGTYTHDPGRFSYDSIRVAPGATLTCSGGGPLIIGCTGDCSIEGTIDLDGKGYAGGGANLPGRGFGGIGGKPGGASSGGGGGGSSLAGTNGGGSAPGAGGEAHHSQGWWPWAAPLCGGGGGGSTGAAGGNGGGCLVLQVRGRLSIPATATLRARGAAAGGSNAGGGGGGVFWLRASDRDVAATPDVSGGAGNGLGGAGASGWTVVEGL